MDRNKLNRRLSRSRLLQRGPQNKPRGPGDAFGLRRNAITVFPGDFRDNADLKEGAERAWKRPEKTPQQEEIDRIANQEKIQEVIRQEEKTLREKKKKWIENYENPPKHVTKIDDRGSTYGRGARKRAHARVWIQPGLGEITVNRQDFADYFQRESLRDHLMMPLLITETLGYFDVTATVQGGGHSGQAGAIRLGIARCLNNYNPDLYRPALKFKGLLTRDSRRVERKKTGLVKSRKAPQWVKR